ncbi:uncharacterized protein LOC129612988 [Condylostylus longicornis]|uniref:uncharacterized protein LOC129612988 n=1 Tax=Condylostylus longicornis TaxID=2530218 RepID=UPI00244DC601|nr:uncharacterized protein LOC129612988 [Condylostylus longicornis]
MVLHINTSEKHISYVNQPGSWVTKEYLQDILRSYKQDCTLTIEKLKFSPVTEKGESYGGVITRAEIEFASEKNLRSIINVVIKTAFEDNKFAMNILQDFDVFNREMKIYNDILPKLNNLLKDAKIDEFLFGEALHIDFENFTMIFEDLCSKNFKTANRLNGLDFQHAKISIRKLAKVHAAAAVLNEQNPTIFNKGYNVGFFTRETNSYNDFFNTIFKSCIDTIYEDLGQMYHIYAKKMELLFPNLMELGRKCFDPSPAQFNTFIHGDIWQSNLMFQYSSSANKQNVTDAVLIDFQFSCFSPNVIDLQYFFNIALTEDVKRANQEDLLKYYYEIFSESLKKLKFRGKIPALNEFYINFLKRDFYGFIVTCINQPIALNESPEVDFHAVHGTNEHAIQCKKLMFKNKRIQDNLRYWLPIFDRKGLLDLKVNTIT